MSSSTSSSSAVEKPLVGASIFVVGQDDGIKPTIEALGARICGKVEDATHALYLGGREVVEELQTCRRLNVPVVEPSWLERMSGLGPEEHWSEVEVGSHVPVVMAEVPCERRRRDAESALEGSICETMSYLTRENPASVEEEELRRAIELSMLEFALVFRKETPARRRASPFVVLGVEESATPTEIKAAYRKRALETHPDKGGKPGDFERVAWAYRSLLRPTSTSPETTILAIKTTVDRDAELKDHRSLVDALFQNDQDRDAKLSNQRAALGVLSLVAVEAGASTKNETNRVLTNTCFYLSLATSYLSGIGALDDATRSPDPNDPSADDALRSETALRLKRLVESAVLAAHPEWAAKGQVGDDVQAFSDFLVFTLDSNTIVGDLAVAVFDTVSGFVDIYKGKNYDRGSPDELTSNLLTIKFLPGHYQPLIPVADDRPDLHHLLHILDANSVLYVITDG